jgi:sec-independent protein translocase protein TatA
MIQNLGFSELLLILLVGLLLFGPKKLPELGRSLGNALRNFKEEMNRTIKEEEKEEKRD